LFSCLLVQTDYEATWPTEALLTGEEATIAAAAAEAVALARAALEVAKDAAQMMRNNSSVKLEKSEVFPSQSDILQLERARLTEMLDTMNNSTTTDTDHQEHHITPSQPKDGSISSSVLNELELQQTQDSDNITVRSGRQSERHARRAKAAEQAANSVISVRSGSSGKKKRSALQEIDYSDPLRYLKGTTSTSKLLTASEEFELSEGIQVGSFT